VAAIPGVQHAGITNGFLDRLWKIAVDEHSPVPPEQRPPASRHPVSRDYFRAMGISLRAGRLFTDRDVQGALPVVIIDETLSRRHFANEDPIGKHLRFEDASREIVGVVAATRAWKRFTAGDVAAPRVYLPYQQEKPWPTMALIVRAHSGDPTRLIPAIRSELAAIDRDQPIHSFKPLEQSVNELNADRRFSTLLLAAFGALAALLAAVGIYGVMSYTVSRRTHEIGIRMALGAQPGSVVGLMMKHGTRLAGAGVAMGLAASFALTRLMESLLFGVSALDRTTFVLTTVFLISVALLACYLPARRATKIDPMIALGHE
jgi:putative ABC transport system permease protein